jgi:hypothetical protein
MDRHIKEQAPGTKLAPNKVCIMCQAYQQMAEENVIYHKLGVDLLQKTS